MKKSYILTAWFGLALCTPFLVADSAICSGNDEENAKWAIRISAKHLMHIKNKGYTELNNGDFFLDPEIMLGKTKELKELKEKIGQSTDLLVILTKKADDVKGFLTEFCIDKYKTATLLEYSKVWYEAKRKQSWCDDQGCVVHIKLNQESATPNYSELNCLFQGPTKIETKNETIPNTTGQNGSLSDSQISTGSEP